ncbi:MAG: metallophosphoesterase family protein [Thaumarchaeota archaeon]|nr:metallophosphoesterase family protein [Nitrososphaerota archaeon]
MSIVAVSDQHLGIETVDKAAFNRFLDQIQTDDSVTDLVLLGDVVDMWRRDASGVFLENKDTFDRIIALQKKMHVYYIAGNHDYHVLRLQGHGYPVAFQKDLSLQQAGVTIRFLHGYEFDEMQREHFMESLCHAMSDEKGSRDNNIWAALGRDDSDLKRFFDSIFRKGSMRAQAQALLLDPTERLKETLGGVEKKARESVLPGQVLIFGHTHRPFIDSAGNLANTGSWLTTAPIHNTYIRIEGGKPRLFVFEGAEITERTDPKK